MIGGRGSAGALLPSAPQITPSVAAGLTVNDPGEVRELVYKVTVPFAAWQVAALTQDITIATLPAKSQLVGIIADTTQAYAGPTGTIALTVGKSAGAAEYMASHDVKTAAVTKGLADADLGTSMVRAAAVQGGSWNWTGTQIVSARITSSIGNLSLLSQGSTTFYLTVRVHP